MNKYKLLIFGGTFNPVHIGHLHILKKACDFIKPSKVLVCIDKIAPWKKMGDLAPYSYRKQMVINLFDKQINYEIYPNDNNLCYSFEIIQEITKKFKDYELYFLVGQDQYEVINTWHKYDVINKLCKIVCYRRSDKPLKQIDSKHIILKDSTFACSSTQNRDQPSIQDLGEKNYQFIKDNFLYLNTKVKKYMTDYRYQHTLRVVDTITQIAIGNKFNDKDLWRCQLAGLLHDIGKEYHDEKLLELVSQKELSSFPSWHCAHGLVSKRLAIKDFNINDKLILDAIENHVIFKDLNTDNKIAKALFCADKLEPARTAKDIQDRQKHLDNCCKDLNKEFPIIYKLNGEKY